MGSSPVFDITIILVTGTIAFALIIFFLISFLFTYQERQRKHLEEKAALKAQYDQEILTSQIEVQNTTLQHIGQELHDNIGQLLTVARINLTIIEESTQEPDNEFYIKQASELVDQSLTDLRALTKSLDGGFIADFGLSQSLTQELQRIGRTGKFETNIQLSGKPYSLGFQREIVLFRIVQEALTNAIKHAGATQLKAHLQYDPSLFTLTITDNGKGFDYQTVVQNAIGQSGAGLRNMQRRAALVGGKCTFLSSPGSGTTVLINCTVSTEELV